MQIKPAFENKNILPIVYAFNNEYSKYFSVALKSMIDDSNNDFNYDVIVFSSDISERNKKILLEMLPKNFSLRFFDISKFIFELFGNSKITEYKYWSVEMYYRIVIPIIMREYDKVLYLDSDTLCKADISKLFEIDFENKELVAIYDAFDLVSDLECSKATCEYLSDILKVEKFEKYFNSGVLLFNVSKINSKEYIELLKEGLKNELTNCPDQDLLNVVFKNKVKLIDESWNLQYHMPILYDRYLHLLDQEKYQKYKDRFENPNIIHYTSPVKPWLDPRVDLAVDFWRCARKTDFYEEILYAMYQNEYVNSRFAINLYLKLQENKKILLWGASIFLENFIKKYGITTNNILGVIDKDQTKHSKTIGGYKIYSPEILKDIEAQEVYLTIVNGQEIRYNEILSYLEENNLSHIKITKL